MIRLNFRNNRVYIIRCFFKNHIFQIECCISRKWSIPKLLFPLSPKYSYCSEDMT